MRTIERRLDTRMEELFEQRGCRFDQDDDGIIKKLKQDRIILIGASTGGVDALLGIFRQFPSVCPPTVIVQHTGGQFTQSLARLLDEQTEASVKEAEHGKTLNRGEILLAPGQDQHLELVFGRTGSVHTELRAGPAVLGHRPSIDVLFQSAVQQASRIVAAVLTGMGRDGAEGLLALRQAGAFTIGQDQSTSVVYGMPKVAFEIGAVAKQLPIDRIGRSLLALSADGSYT